MLSSKLTKINKNRINSQQIDQQVVRTSSLTNKIYQYQSKIYQKLLSQCVVIAQIWIYLTGIKLKDIVTHYKRFQKIWFST